MAIPISSIGSAPAIAPIRSDATLTSGPASGQPGFGSVLTNALTDASKAEKTANDASAKFATGDPEVGIHEVMIAAEKANISVRYAVTLKNKLLEAYRELMNTPL